MASSTYKIRKFNKYIDKYQVNIDRIRRVRKVNKTIITMLNENDKELKELVDMFKEQKLSKESLFFYIEKKYNLTQYEYKRLIDLLTRYTEDKKYNFKELISVIIPTYNRQEMLLKAVTSVLKQNYNNYEIIIVDDCSTDKTQEKVKKLQEKYKQIKYIKNQVNMHAGRSRQVGYNVSKGDYIVFLDDDDYYTDYDFFNKMMHIHKQQGELSFVSANSYLYYYTKKIVKTNDLNVRGIINGQEYLEEFQTELNKAPSTFTTVFNKSKMEATDFKHMRMMNDSSIFMRALLVGDAYVTEDIVGVYNIHESNISSDLPLDFLIENLNEKYNILRDSKPKDRIRKPEKWLIDQVNLTIRYFMSGNNPKREDMIEIFDWIESYVLDTRTIKLKYNIIKLYIVSKSKHIVKRIIRL